MKNRSKKQEARSQKRKSRILAFLLASGFWLLNSSAFGQTPITTDRLITNEIQVVTPALVAVSSVNAQVIGNGGSATYYYWIVAKFAAGNATPSNYALVISAPNTLSASNRVRVTWGAVAGATGYDVLRTTSAQLPNGAANIGRSLNQATSSFDDTGGALVSYTVATLKPRQLALQFVSPYWDALGQVAPPVSGSNHGRIYYDLTLNQWVASANGGPYLPFGSGAGAGIKTLNGLSSQDQFLTVACTSGLDVNIQPSIDTNSFCFPDASATARGFVTTGAQVFGGNKVFNNDLATNGAFSALGVSSQAQSNISSVTFTGAGLNDLTAGGTYTADNSLAYCVAIDGTAPDTFSWGTGGSCVNGALTVAITGAAQNLSNGITVTFAAVLGHTATNQWDFVVSEVAPLSLTDATGGALLTCHNSGAGCPVTGFPRLDQVLDPTGDKTFVMGGHALTFSGGGEFGISTTVAGNALHVTGNNNNGFTFLDQSPLFVQATIVPGNAIDGPVHWFQTTLDMTSGALVGDGNVNSRYYMVGNNGIAGSDTAGFYSSIFNSSSSTATLAAFYNYDGDTVLDVAHITSLAGYHYRTPLFNIGGSIGNATAFLAEDVTGAINNYGIRTGIAPAGGNFFGDRGTFKSNTAFVQLITFTGAGLNDATSGGTYTGTNDLAYCVQIDASVPSPDTFEWGTGGSCSNGATGVGITGAAQNLSNGVQITFAAIDGHTIGNKWTFTAYAPIPLTLQDHNGNTTFRVKELGDSHGRRYFADTGTALVAGDFVPSGGWGATGSVAVTSASTDQSFHITVTGAGGGYGLNPTVAFTFKNGTWTTVPIYVCSMETGGTGALSFFTPDNTSATVLTLTYAGTPGAATYKIACNAWGQ